MGWKDGRLITSFSFLHVKVSFIKNPKLPVINALKCECVDVRQGALIYVCVIY